MSYVTIYKVCSNGDVVEHGEARNNHAGAPLVWQILGAEYSYLSKTAHPYFLMDPGLEAFWKAWPNSKMSRLENVLLGATFDRVWVKRELLPELIEACEWFLHTHVASTRPDTTKYDTRTFAGLIQNLKEVYEDLDARGAAFNMCSAVASFWHIPEEDVDDGEEPRPFNIDRDKVQPRGEYKGKSPWELSTGLEG